MNADVLINEICCVGRTAYSPRPPPSCVALTPPVSGPLHCCQVGPLRDTEVRDNFATEKKTRSQQVSESIRVDILVCLRNRDWTIRKRKIKGTFMLLQR